MMLQPYKVLSLSAYRRLGRAARLAKFDSQRSDEVESSLNNAILECQEAIELLKWAKDENAKRL